MNYLKIENGKGFFLDSDNHWKEIDTIQKEDILHLLDCATDSQIDFQMDRIESDNIKNEAHKIIYDNLYRKFFELSSNKNRFLDESEGLYKEALQKYQE